VGAEDTIRHLVFADDCWTGQMLLGGQPFHPWGLPNTDYPADRVSADLGIDLSGRRAVRRAGVAAPRASRPLR
jgi:hypothetical protein